MATQKDLKTIYYIVWINPKQLRRLNISNVYLKCANCTRNHRNYYWWAKNFIPYKVDQLMGSMCSEECLNIFCLRNL